MKSFKKEFFIYETYDAVVELEEKDRLLLEEADKICKTAYANYSNFKVGAAVRLKSGKIITGNNQENAAYPSGLCAERVAMFYAHANFPNDDIECIAVIAEGGINIDDTPVSPCGACRQVIAEYENKTGKNIRIILSSSNKTKIYIINSIEDLLPLSFSDKDLK